MCGRVFEAEVWNMDMCWLSLGYKTTALIFVAIPSMLEFTF